MSKPKFVTGIGDYALNVATFSLAFAVLNYLISVPISVRSMFVVFIVAAAIKLVCVVVDGVTADGDRS